MRAESYLRLRGLNTLPRAIGIRLNCRQDLPGHQAGSLVPNSFPRWIPKMVAPITSMAWVGVTRVLAVFAFTILALADESGKIV
jgi:hypothetical protein